MRTCDTCQKSIFVASFPAHMDYHARQDRRIAFVAMVAATELDKEGIVVSAKETGIDFGVVGTESSVEVQVTVENTTQDYVFLLQSCRLRSSSRGDEHGVRFSARLISRTKFVRPGRAFMRTVSVVFHPSYAGQYEDTLELVFWHCDLKRKFIITRQVKAIVGDREDHDQIRPSAPYTGPRDVPRFTADPTKVVRSLRPLAWSETIWTERLPEYEIPEKVIQAAFAPELVRKPNANMAKANVQRLMPSAFNVTTYATWWQVLLWVEEEQVRQDLDHYALQDVEIVPRHPRYECVCSILRFFSTKVTILPG